MNTRATLGRAIFGLDLNAHALEERGWQNAARANDDGVILHVSFALPPCSISTSSRANSLDAGSQQDLELAGLLRRVHPLPILHLGAGEGLTSIGQCHLGVALFGDAGGRLQRAVAASNNQHVLAAILLRVDQTINHLGLVLARNIELARRAAAADGEQHGASAVDARVVLISKSPPVGTTASTRSPYLTLSPVFFATLPQKASSFSLLISLNLTLPIMAAWQALS